MSDDRLARIALSRLGEPGNLSMAGLVAELGAPRLYAELLAGRDHRGMRDEVASRLEGTDPAADLERAARLGIRYVVPGDPEWPAGLDALEGCEPLQRMGRAPLGLWVRGPVRLDALAAPVAVVGSRSATTYGTDVAAELGAGLARAGSAVVSGAAFGIDQAAHRGALAGGGVTVAVLACGVDRAYPAAHKRLLDHLADHGAVVSELPPGCAPTRLRFLARNRIIAALTRGTVVVEAAVRSGALNTAGWALRLNQPVMGVPGPVTSAPSEGVHQLIRAGAATLVTRADDVLELTGGMGEHLAEAPSAPVTARDRLTRTQQQVLEAVPLVRPAPHGSIARTAGVALATVESALRTLHQQGLVERLPTGWRQPEPEPDGAAR